MKSFSICDTTINFVQDEEHLGVRSEQYAHYLLWKELLDELGRHGFYVSEDKEIKKNYPILSKDRKYGRFGNLEFKAERYPSGFRITFFQNVVFENPCGGYYDFDKREKMPYLIGKRFEWMVNIISKFFEKNGIADKTEPLCRFAEDKIKLDFVKSFHHPQKDMQFELSDFDGETTADYNGTDRDGKKIHNGDIKYCRDYSGYLQRGKVYHNINNMWWVITDKYTIRNVCASCLFDIPTDITKHRVAPYDRMPTKYKARRKAISETSTKELERELCRRKKEGKQK